MLAPISAAPLCASTAFLRERLALFFQRCVLRLPLSHNKSWCEPTCEMFLGVDDVFGAFAICGGRMYIHSRQEEGVGKSASSIRILFRFVILD